MATNEQIIGLIKTAEGQQRARRLYGTNKEGRRAAFILPDGPSPSGFAPDLDGANVDGASVARLIYQVRLPSDPPGPPLKNNSRVGMWMSTVWDANTLTPTRKASHYSLYVLAKGFCESRDFPQEVSAVVGKAETAAGVQHGKTETSIFVAEHELGYSAEDAEGFGLLTEAGDAIQSEAGAALIDEGASVLPANGKLVVQQQVLVFRGPDIGWDRDPPDADDEDDAHAGNQDGQGSVPDPHDYYFGYGTAFNNAGPTPGFAAGIVKARKPELGGSCWHHGFYVKKTAVDAFPFRYQKYWGVCAVGFDPKGDGSTVRAMPYMGLGVDVAEAPLHLKGPIPLEQRFEYDGEAGGPYQLGKLSFVGRSSGVGGDTFAATPVEMAEVTVEITEPGHNAEAAEARIRTVQAGDLEDRLIVGAGVYSPNAAGGDKGADTLNVKALYVDGFLAEGDDPDDAGVVTATGVVLKKGVPLVRAVAPSDPRLRSVKVYRNAVTDNAAAAFAAGSIGSVDVRAGHKIKWGDDADTLMSGTDYYYYLATVTRKQVEGPLTPIGHVVYRAVQGVDIEDATLDLAGSKFTGQAPASRIGALSSDHRCLDPLLKDFSGYWQVTGGAPALVSGTADTLAMNVPNAISFTAAAALTRFQIVQANKPAGYFIEVEAGANYKCSFISRVLAGFNGQLRLQVNFYKADQTPCSTANGAVADVSYMSAPATVTMTTTVAGQIATPADCAYVKILALCDWNTNVGALAAGGALASNFRLVAKKSGADINASAIDWTTHVAGSGKPADNATVGAALGTNLKTSGGATVLDSDALNAKAQDNKGYNRNPTFQRWTGGAGSAPDNWSIVGSVAVTKQTSGQRYGDWSLEAAYPATDTQFLSSTSAELRVPPSADDYYAIEYEVELVGPTGDFSRAGVWWRVNYQDTSNFKAFTLDLSAEHPAATVNKVYSGCKVVSASVTGSPTGVPGSATLYLMGNHAVIGGAVTAKTLRWHRVRVRKATREEIRAAKALDDNGDLARDLTPARKISSQIMTHAAGGTYTGELAATVGATLGTNLKTSGGVTVGDHDALNSKAHDVRGYNRQPTFQRWTGSLPDNWTSTGATVTKQTTSPRYGDWSLEVAYPASDNQYLFASGNEVRTPPSADDYYVIDYEVELVSGDFNRAGIWWRVDYQDSSNYKHFTLDLSIEHPGAVTGKIYAGSKAVPAALTGSPTGLPSAATLFLIGNHNLMGDTVTAKTLRWHRVSVRKASKEEIKAATLGALASKNSVGSGDIDSGSVSTAHIVADAITKPDFNSAGADAAMSTNGGSTRYCQFDISNSASSGSSGLILAAGQLDADNSGAGEAYVGVFVDDTATFTDATNFRSRALFWQHVYIGQGQSAPFSISVYRSFASGAGVARNLSLRGIKIAGNVTVKGVSTLTFINFKR